MYFLPRFSTRRHLVSRVGVLLQQRDYGEFTGWIHQDQPVGADRGWRRHDFGAEVVKSQITNQWDPSAGSNLSVVQIYTRRLTKVSFGRSNAYSVSAEGCRTYRRTMVSSKDQYGRLSFTNLQTFLQEK